MRTSTKNHQEVSNLPLGCEGRIVTFNSTTNRAIIEIFDETGGRRTRYDNVDCIAQTASILATYGTTYKPGDYVYVAWVGGQRTTPIVVGHIRCSMGTSSSSYESNSADKTPNNSEAADEEKAKQDAQDTIENPAPAQT